MGNYTYEIPEDSYVMWAGGDEVIFMIMTMPDSSWDIDFWILGLNFFHNYYSVFDMDQGKVGFAPSVVAYDSFQSSRVLLGLNK